jgi:hypothetical protein
MSAWSYAETCAVGLSPRLAPDGAILNALPMPEGYNTSDSGFRASNNTYLTHTRHRFLVLHPLHILAHFVALRSSPRELSEGQPICYVTSGPDGRIGSTGDSLVDPEFMFLKRSKHTSPDDMKPYAPFQSVFDQSLGDIKASLWIFPHDWGKKDIRSRSTLTEYENVQSCDDNDASLVLLPEQLSVIKYEPVVEERDTGRSSNGGSYLPTRSAAYMGIALDFARVMRADTDNTQFRDLLSYIFPFMCMSISDRLDSLCEVVHDVATSGSIVNNMLKRLTSIRKLTFRIHADTIITWPDAEYDYNDHMPQRLTVLSQAAPTKGPNPFRYYFRSAAIQNMVSECSYNLATEKSTRMSAFINATCSSSGKGYCYKYFSIKRLVKPVSTDIPVSCIASELPINRRPKYIKLRSKHVSYFYNDAHIKFDRSGNTLYVPQKRNYSSFDAIGTCSIDDGTGTGIAVGPDGPPATHLVFYKMTVRDSHPVDSAVIEAAIHRWKKRARLDGVDDLPAVLVFVTNNKGFKEEQQSYTTAGLKEQYVYLSTLD